jgi:hypothetical protein
VRDPNLAMDERGRPRDLAMDWACRRSRPNSATRSYSRPTRRQQRDCGHWRGTAAGRAGYSQDRPYLPTPAARNFSAGLACGLFSYGDGTRNSGSPILIETEAGWRVLGLVWRWPSAAPSFGIGC